MTVLHEARETYDASKDKVGRLTLRVEHAPGQRAALEQFLGGIATQAGVYFAEIEGEVHGESTVQRVDQQPEAAQVGARSEPEGTRGEGGISADGNGGVAGSAGEGAVEGQGNGSSGGKGLSRRARTARR